MKIRTDYVSNSSSSSFIIGHHEMFNHFNVTKQDILDALIDSYGKDRYELIAKEYEAIAKNYPPEYHKESIESGMYGPFYVYDLNEDKDKELAIKTWGDLLKEWTANQVHVDNDGIETYGIGYANKFEEIVETMSNIYGFNSYEMMDYINGFQDEVPKIFIHDKIKNPETGLYGHYEDIEDNVLTVIKDMKEKVGMMTNLDALKCDLARFFVHADDNELFHGKSTYSEYGKYESESYTYDRICEIVFNYLVKIGRINPSDNKFLDMMRIPDENLSKWEKDDGLLWNFRNGKNLEWRDLKDCSLTWCMHEG